MRSRIQGWVVDTILWTAVVAFTVGISGLGQAVADTVRELSR